MRADFNSSNVINTTVTLTAKGEEVGNLGRTYHALQSNSVKIFSEKQRKKKKNSVFQHWFPLAKIEFQEAEKVQSVKESCKALVIILQSSIPPPKTGQPALGLQPLQEVPSAPFIAWNPKNQRGDSSLPWVLVAEKKYRIIFNKSQMISSAQTLLSVT